MKTPLCEIAYKYKTDKCPQIRHSYTPIYWDLFKDKRNDIKKVFEMGIGYPEIMPHSGTEYISGASLYMWREFFPNANIYGADIDPRAMVTDDRIKTFLCDETEINSLKNVINKVGRDIDVFIDDGKHWCNIQVDLAKTVLPMLKKDVIYIVEDVFSVRRFKDRMKGWECVVPKLEFKGKYRENLVIIKNK